MDKRKIKIAQVVLNLDIGGLEMLVVDLIKGIDQSQFNVIVVCLREKGKLADQLQDLGIKVYSLGNQDKVELKAFWKLARILKGEKIDIVHCHNTAGYFYGGIAAILAGFKKIIYTEHGRVFPDTLRRMLAERILSWFTYKIVAVSENMKHCLVRYEKIHQCKIEVIYNGVDTEKFKKIEDKKWRKEKRAAFSLGENDIVIGNVARLVDVKDHNTLIRAFAFMKKRMQDNEEGIEKPLRLLIVGCGPELDNLKILCAEVDLDFVDRFESGRSKFISSAFTVLFLGLREDIPELMNIMDVFALSSKNEGISLTLLEAMACGVPVVATRVGGNPEIVKDGANGFLCASGDTADLAEKILKGVNLNVYFESFSFTSEHMIRQYEGLYFGK